MKITFLKLLLGAWVALAVTSCSTYSKAIGGKDYQRMYSLAMEYMDKGKYQKAVNLLTVAARPLASTLKSDSVVYYTGLAYYKMGMFETSATYFDNIRKNFRRSGFVEEAEYMYAKGFYFLSPPPYRDQTATMQAIMSIDEYLQHYPNSVKREALLENMDELTSKLHEKSYLNARSYYKTERYKAAIVALGNALFDYPTTKYREEMLYLIVKSSWLLADNSEMQLQRERYVNTMDAYYTFVSEYPESEHRPELDRIEERVQKLIASYGETAASPGTGE